MTAKVHDKSSPKISKQRILAYADARSKGETKLNAYKIAGYKGTTESAIAVQLSRLEHHPLVNKRVKERKWCGGGTKAEAHEMYTREWTLSQHNELKELALATINKDGSPDITNATRNLEGIGRIGGYYSDGAPQLANNDMRDSIISQQAALLTQLLARATLPVIDVSPTDSLARAKGDTDGIVTYNDAARMIEDSRRFTPSLQPDCDKSTANNDSINDTYTQVIYKPVDTNANNVTEAVLSDVCTNNVQNNASAGGGNPLDGVALNTNPPLPCATDFESCVCDKDRPNKELGE